MRTSMSTMGRTPRSLVLTAAGAMILSLAPATSATAAVADVCPPPDGGAENAFSDDDGSPHEQNIDCAAGYGLVKGTSDTEFDPGGLLTRGQAATILVEWAEKALGATLETDGTDEFSDTSGTTHEVNIDKAVDNGLVKGSADGTYRPGATISRAQLATIAVEATEFVLGRSLTADATDEFSDDDGNIHEPNIEKAVDNAILNGTGDATFSPDVDVQRDQTATIVVQAAGEVLHPVDKWAPSRIPEGEPDEAAASSDPAQGTVVTVSTAREYYTLDTDGDGAADVLVRYATGDTSSYTYNADDADGDEETVTISLAELERYLSVGDVVDPGTYDPGDTAHAMVADKPSAPAGLTAVSDDVDGDGVADDVTVTWDPSVNPNVDYYSLSRAAVPTDGSDPLYDEIAEIAASATAYEDLDLPDGDYTYRVNAFYDRNNDNDLSNSSTDGDDGWSESSEPDTVSVRSEA